MSTSEALTKPATGREKAILTVLIAVSTALADLAAAMLGAIVGVGNSNVTAGIVIWGLSAMLFVLLICRSFGRRARRKGFDSALLLVMSGALVGFLLSSLLTGGIPVLTRLVTDSAVLTLVGDLVLWLTVAALGAQLGLRSSSGPDPVTTPYG